ncbi:MAG: hypothetical protein KIS66_12545 [Fimbriimonadaceae bacterium]|nr:hypothetical protein [Fimbriimonadaceae bacterium]
MLKARIPIRTRADWKEDEPGYAEIDLVHHCGFETSGEYLHSLTLTDVATGWTEGRALRNRSRTSFLEAIRSIRASLPFPLRDLDSDSGGEFLNEAMLRFCDEEASASPDPDRTGRTISAGSSRRTGAWCGRASVTTASREKGRGGL